MDKVCPGIFGISVRRYQQLAKEGILPPADNGYIDFIQATKHLIFYYQKLVEGQGSITLTEERARLARAQADMTILEYSKAQNKVLDKEQVEQAWLVMGQACRSRLLSIPVKVTPLLDGKGKAERKKILEDYIYEALNELSQTRPADIKTTSEATDIPILEIDNPTVKEKDKQHSGKKKGRPQKRDGDSL